MARPRSSSAVHEAKSRLSVLLAPKRRLALIPVVLVAAAMGYLLFPSFPTVPPALSGPEAEKRGRAILGEILDAHGGLAAFRAAGAFEAKIDDRWAFLFEGHAPWPGGSGVIDALFAPAAAGFMARFSFNDGSLWGHDGDAPWAVGTESDDVSGDAPAAARRATAFLSRLWLMPFSVVVEAAEVRALHEQPEGTEGTDLLEIDFRPRSGGPADRWLIWADADSHRIQRMMMAAGARKSGPIESCFVEARKTVSGVLLPSWLTCYTASKLSIELHRILFEAVRSVTPNARAFRPPEVFGSAKVE